MLKIIILESYLACRWRVRSIHLANGIVKKKTNNVEREREKVYIRGSLRQKQ